MDDEKQRSASKRFEELYREAEKKKGKQDKNKDELEMKQHKEEYTFQPNAHKRKNLRAASPPQKPTTQRETVSEYVQ